MIAPDLAPSTIASAIEENAIEGVKAWAGWPEINVHEDPAILWTAADVPFFVFNNVLRLRAAPSDTDAIIDDVLARARSRNVPMAWWITPSTQPADLGERLEAKGFNHAAILQGMAANLLTLDDTLPRPSGLTIEQVSEAEALKTWCRVMTAVNELPESADYWF